MPGEPFFKERLPRKARKAAETALMRQVRKLDGHCRFPLCGCRRRGIVLDVCHPPGGHRGMGGGALALSDSSRTLLLCRWRHRAGKVSIDRGTLRWRVLSPSEGTRGPLGWSVDAAALAVPNLALSALADPDGWIDLGEEIRPHYYQPTHLWQHSILQALAEMER